MLLLLGKKNVSLVDQNHADPRGDGADGLKNQKKKPAVCIQLSKRQRDAIRRVPRDGRDADAGEHADHGEAEDVEFFVAEDRVPLGIRCAGQGFDVAAEDVGEDAEQVSGHGLGDGQADLLEKSLASGRRLLLLLRVAGCSRG